MTTADAFGGPLPGQPEAWRPHLPAVGPAGRRSVVRQAVLGAWRDGVEAARAGHPASVCPHLLPVRAHRRLEALWWLRGHQSVARNVRRTTPDPRPSRPREAPPSGTDSP